MSASLKSLTKMLSSTKNSICFDSVTVSITCCLKADSSVNVTSAPETGLPAVSFTVPVTEARQGVADNTKKENKQLTKPAADTFFFTESS